MPNWCEGYLKVRGTFKNLRNFVCNGLEVVGVFGKTEPLPPITEDAESFSMDCNGEEFWMKNTRRHFCSPDYINFYAGENEAEDGIILILPMRAAWAINAEQLQKLCQEFHVDMKIQGFEMGMQFSQLIEIVNGEITQDETIEYDDWDWDCPCPNTGG